MHSIRFKISAITIAAILVSILAVLVTVIATVGEESDRNATQNLALLCDNTCLSLNEYFDSIEQSVEMAASITADSLDSVALVEGGVAGKFAETNGQTPEQVAELDAYLAAHSAMVEEAFGSVANHTNGVAAYYYCISPNISRKVHGFFWSRVGRTGFEVQPPLDAGKLDPRDFEHTTWYFTAVQRGRPSWIGPYSADVLDEMLTVSYITPIYKAGALVGVLGMDIPFETMVSQISSLRVYDTGYCALLNEDGQVLYHPTMPRGSMPAVSGINADGKFFRQQSNEGREVRYTLEGVEKQLAFSTLSNGTKLVVSAPVREITASWLKLSRSILIITLLILAAFALILVIVLSFIVHPLQRLTTASGRLAAGDYDVALDYKGRDEVGALTDSFRQMRDHISRNIIELNRMVNTDDLTGLPSVRRFYRMAEEGKNRILRTGNEPVMLYLSLSGMKGFNRQYGREEGDRLLRAAADALAYRFGNERCCRLAQDNFAVLTDAGNLDKRLGVLLEDFALLNEGRTLPVRVGVYPHRMGNVDTSTACDRAKFACDKLRGTFVSDFCWFDENMLKDIEGYRYIVNTLDQALSERWIKVCFQPIVRASTGRVCDEEALSRWIDPDRGIISPGEFIPILEASRQISKLDIYVLDQIILKMQEQEAEGLPVVPQSLNLSRIDFESCDIVEEVRRRMDDAGIPREKLTVEVTESAISRDFEFMKTQVERLQELGFRVWMDDFGSGYSSLDVLQDIHFDLIKFDMRFMHRFEESRESKIILSELLRMTKALGVDTVVEGVETEEQVRFLREAGCGRIQGYYYSKPLPLEEIVRRCREGTWIGYE